MEPSSDGPNAAGPSPGGPSVLKRVAEAHDFSDFTRGRVLRRIVHSAPAIAARVRELGAEITAAYPPEAEILAVGVLKGSFVFLADLVRHIRRPVQIDFIGAASYGAARTSSGTVELYCDLRVPIEGRHVLIVEDIVDSGLTLERLREDLRGRGPASVEVCALLHKRIAGKGAWEPRWVGFDAPEEFLVGYGLDDAEELRNLPFIASLPTESDE